MNGSHTNRKASGGEMAYATQVIQEAFPEYEVVWGTHGDYGGHRAPRDHTLAFRLRDRWGKYLKCSPLTGRANGLGELVF